MKIFGIIVCLVLTAFLRLSAQTVVEVRADSASMLIGEQVHLQVKCTTRAGAKVTFPTYQPQQEIVPGLEVVENGNIDTLQSASKQVMTLQRSYTVTAFDSALYTIPPFKVNVDGKEYASQGSIGLKVSTVAVDTVHVDKFNGPHDVVELPFEWTARQTLLALLAMLAGCGAFVLAVRLSDPRLITRRIVVHPPTPPHVTALKDMGTLKATEAGNAKQYYMELTATLRQYIEGRFGFNAREMTTSEIIDELTASDHADALSELQDILRTADLVKFAKHEASLSEQDRSMMQALDYVQTTKFVPSEAPQPHIEYVTLSGKQQKGLRLAMKTAAIVLATLTLGLTAYVAYDLYLCFA